MLDCGVPDLPIVITPANLTKKIEKHNLTKDDLQSLNILLNSPLIVYHSQNQGKYYSAFSVITERKNNEGYLCVVIYINEKINKIEINNIASIHYRNINSLIKWCEENYLIDSNIEKCKKVFSGSCHNDSKFEYLLSLLDTAKLKQKNQNTKGLGKNIWGYLGFEGLGKLVNHNTPHLLQREDGSYLDPETDRDITQLDAIKGLSISDGGLGTDIDKQFLLNWNDYVKESSSEHEQRVIIVGNLLRGYQNAPEKSKLISFTTHDGKVLKGILTPKNNTDNGAKLIMSKYDINDFAAFIKDSVSNGENKTYYLERGMKLCTNATNEYSQSYTSYPFILYCEDSGTFKRLKTIKEWQDIADNGRGFEDYTKDGKKHYVMQFKYVQKLEELISLLDKYKFKVELYPSEAQRIFGKKSEDVLKHGNWKPLETHTEAIPKNKTISPLLSNAIKLAALKNGGSPLSGVYNRMPNQFWRLEDRFFPTDEKLKKIYDNICKSGKLSVTLLQQLKLYSNDTRRNINQISGIIGKNDRTYVGALLLRGSTCGHRTSSFGILSTGREAFRRRELQQQLLRQFAELEGIWYKSKEDFITKNRLVIAKDEYGRDIAGTETKVYHDPLCNLVYKFLRINANSNYLYDNLLERIIVHNLMFGDKTALYIEGLFFDDNFISIAVSQPFIRFAHRLTKKEQQDKFFAQFTNFTRTNKTCIVNDDLVVYDLHNNNVLVDDNGEYYVIDCYAKFYRKDDLTNHYNYENVNSTLSGPYVSETTDCEGHSIKIGDIVAFPKAEYGGKTFLFGVVKSIKLVMDKEHSDVGVFLIKRNKKMLCFDKEYYRENNLIQYVTNTGQYDEASLIKSFERCVNDYFASTYEKDKSLLIKTIHDDINTAEYRLREYKADMKRYDNYAKHLSWQEAQSYFHAKLYADTYQEWINNVYSSPLLSNAIKLAALKNE